MGEEPVNLYLVVSNHGLASGVIFNTHEGKHTTLILCFTWTLSLVSSTMFLLLLLLLLLSSGGDSTSSLLEELKGGDDVVVCVGTFKACSPGLPST